MSIKKILSIVLLGVSIVMIGTGVFLMNSSKYIFTSSLSKSLNYIIKSGNSIQGSNIVKEINNSDRYKISTNSSIKRNNETQTLIYGDIYNDNNNLYINLDSKYEDEDFIGIEALIQNSKGYYKIKEAMDKFYFQDLEIDNNIEFTNKDFNILVNHVKNSIFKELSDKDFVKTKETLEIEGKKFTTTKISLVFTERRLYNSLVNLVDSISKDKKAIQVLQKVSSEINKDTIDLVSEFIKSFSDRVSDTELFTLSVYVKSSNMPIRTEISIGGSGSTDSIASNTLAINFDAYDNADNHKTYSFKIMNNTSVILELREEYTNKNKSNILFVVNNIVDFTEMLKIKGTKEITSTSIDFNLEIISGDTTIGNASYTLETITKNKEYKLDVDISFNMNEETIGITSSNRYYLNETFPSINVSNAVSTDEITEEEIEDLMNYLDEKLSIIGLGGLLVSDDDYYDNDYDDDWYYDDEDDWYYEDDDSWNISSPIA